MDRPESHGLFAGRQQYRQLSAALSTLGSIAHTNEIRIERGQNSSVWTDSMEMSIRSIYKWTVKWLAACHKHARLYSGSTGRCPQRWRCMNCMKTALGTRILAGALMNQIAATVMIDWLVPKDDQEADFSRYKLHRLVALRKHYLSA